MFQINKLVKLTSVLLLVTSANLSITASANAHTQVSRSNHHHLTKITPTNKLQKALTSMQQGTAPWLTTNNGQPIRQPLHNGNEIWVSVNIDGPLGKCYRRAIRNWNHLNILKLVEVSDPKSASVVLNGANATINAQATTRFDTNQLTGQINQANVYFSDDGLLRDPADMDTIATHEIGHALGFASDPLTKNVAGHMLVNTMYNGLSTGDTMVPLGMRQSNALHKIYDTQINAAATQNNNN